MICAGCSGAGEVGGEIAANERGDGGGDACRLSDDLAVAEGDAVGREAAAGAFAQFVLADCLCGDKETRRQGDEEKEEANHD